MAGWETHTGAALILEIDNIDTDQLIPARFMSTPRSAGYADFLLYDVRRDASGNLLPEFPLNAQPGASILIAGRNFGTGSSREAAVYALADSGFRVILAPSFGDIFAANAVNNGVLPAQMADSDIAQLKVALTDAPDALEISLNDKTVRCGALSLPFVLDDTWRLKLQNGWDDIDLTLQHGDRIAAFRRARQAQSAWAWPRNAG